MIYSLNGERCTSSSRLLVEAAIYDTFTAMVAEKAKRIVVGHPLDPKTVVGPLIHPVHEKKVLEYIEIGKAEGATVAAGGAKFAGPGGGCYVSPTLFTGAQQPDADRAGRNLWPGADGHPVQGRGRGAGARQ